MFKNFLKSRLERNAPAPPQRPPGGPAYGYVPPQGQTGGGQAGAGGNNFMQQPANYTQPSYGPGVPPPGLGGNSMQSPMPHGGVEYNQSPPPFMPGGNSMQSPMPHGGVEYVQSPPVPLAPPQHGDSMASMGPAVEYRASAPSMPPEPVGRNGSAQTTGPAVDYNVSAPIAGPRPSPQNAHGRQPPQNPPYPVSQAPRVNNYGYQYPPTTVYAAELSAQTPQMFRPQELPASPVPQRYELHNSPRPQPPNTPSLAATSPSSVNSTWSNPSSRSTAPTTPAISPPPYPARFSPVLPQQKESSPQAQGIIKYTVNIFCQRKAEPGMEREEIPRDVREFRLAKVALIPVAAGERKFVSLDVVFGEIDKAAAGFLEKHYLIIPDSDLTLLHEDSVAGNEAVWKISQLKIAYKGTPSVIYMTFRSAEDESNFQVVFRTMKSLSEAC